MWYLTVLIAAGVYAVSAAGTRKGWASILRTFFFRSFQASFHRPSSRAPFLLLYPKGCRGAVYNNFASSPLSPILS